MSTSLHLWQSDAQDVFAELELAHRAVRGRGRGERLLTQQVTYAYVTALAAQFQLYCRAVHTEMAEAIVASISNPALASVLKGHLIDGRSLDRGNANVSNLGSDFGRFELRFWNAVLEHRKANQRRKEKLEAIIVWRNAVGHGDIERKHVEGRLIPAEIHLGVCREWRSALSGLVSSIDLVLASHCSDLGIARPW